MNSSEQAFRELRERILQGRLRPGTALKERELCEELNVSRTPVREALRRLSAEGLAEVRPGRSIIVSSFEEDELSEIFELGIVLESFVAGLAARKASRDDVISLELTVEQMARVVEADSPVDKERYIGLDQHFHDAIAAAARNPRIAQILRQTMSIPVLANVYGRYHREDYATSLAHHRIILQAIADGDAEWAEDAMRSHVRTGQAVLRRPG